MKLMSHNSWTFMTPKTSLGKMFNFMARCQSKNIVEQYEIYGVRYFDLRIRLDKNNQLIIAHGLFEYDNSQEQLKTDLEFLNNKKDVFVRVCLEVRKPSEDTDGQKCWFVNYCKYLESNYLNIMFCGGNPIYSSFPYYNFAQCNPTSEGCHASWATKCKLDDLWPWLYAKLHNKESRKKDTTKEYLSLDFIEI